jgi:hypothetical protein
LETSRQSAPWSACSVNVRDRIIWQRETLSAC